VCSLRKRMLSKRAFCGSPLSRFNVTVLVLLLLLMLSCHITCFNSNVLLMCCQCVCHITCFNACGSPLSRCCHITKFVILSLLLLVFVEESFVCIPSLQGPVGEYNLKTGLPIDPTGWLFKGIHAQHKKKSTVQGDST